MPLLLFLRVRTYAIALHHTKRTANSCPFFSCGDLAGWRTTSGSREELATTLCRGVPGGYGRFPYGLFNIKRTANSCPFFRVVTLPKKYYGGSREQGPQSCDTLPIKNFIRVNSTAKALNTYYINYAKCGGQKILSAAFILYDS